MIGFLVARLRTQFWTAFYHAAGNVVFEQLGRGAKFDGWIDIPLRGGRISIGRNVRICRFVEFSVAKGAELIIEDGAFVGPGTVISAHRRVSIGADALVAEHVSIHDNDHSTRTPSLPINAQGFEAESLEVGADCWIGARAILVKGAGLGRRCVLGAGAVLTQRLPANTMAAGVPARPIDKKTAAFPESTPEERKAVGTSETPFRPPPARSRVFCPGRHSARNKIGRVLWRIIWTTLYRPSPKIFHGWRRFLLRSFGASIERSALPYPSAKIWAPWNLEMGEHSCLGENVDCYSVARITLGAYATVSQYCFLCTATHDIETPDLALCAGPIFLRDGAWIAADVFVGPGVTIGANAVVGARASVFRDVPDDCLAVGTPARCTRRKWGRHLTHKTRQP
jgi:putative colanic acid biosynthesis acetyltransferase WcaF